MKTLNDKVAVITGAGSGIGRALAVESAGKGALLALSEKSEPGLAFFDAKGKPRAVLGQTSLGGKNVIAGLRRPKPYSLFFFDAAGKLTYRAPR